jgi:electron transport complex protein RnfA
MANEYLLITIGAILVNNFVLAQILGICPFLGVSQKIETALGMSGAVVFVLTLATFVTSSISRFVLAKDSYFAKTSGFDLAFLETLVFILVIAGLVQIVEIILQKIAPPLYRALGIYLPLITTNCAVLGAAVINAKVSRGVLNSTIFGFCSAVGFGLALLLFASIREKLALAKIPKVFQGTSIALITSGILAMAFLGFAGLVK